MNRSRNESIDYLSVCSTSAMIYFTGEQRQLLLDTRQILNLNSLASKYGETNVFTSSPKQKLMLLTKIDLKSDYNLYTILKDCS